MPTSRSDAEVAALGRLAAALDDGGVVAALRRLIVDAHPAGRRRGERGIAGRGNVLRRQRGRPCCQRQLRETESEDRTWVEVRSTRKRCSSRRPRPPGRAPRGIATDLRASHSRQSSESRPTPVRRPGLERRAGHDFQPFPASAARHVSCTAIMSSCVRQTSVRGSESPLMTRRTSNPNSCDQMVQAAERWPFQSVHAGDSCCGPVKCSR